MKREEKVNEEKKTKLVEKKKQKKIKVFNSFKSIYRIPHDKNLQSFCGESKMLQNHYFRFIYNDVLMCF